LLPAIQEAFARGRLDIPFSASIHAHSQVFPRRDRRGAVRYLSAGQLPFSASTLARHGRLLGDVTQPADDRLIEAITADINYFLEPN
jgi:methylaspartate mutase epsilon subunit